MKKVKFQLLGLCLFCAALLAQNAAAQLAKYNRAGDLIWINGLLTDKTECEIPKSFTGKTAKVDSFNADNAVGYEFSLRLPTGKQQKFQASISLDEGVVVVDFENLMQKNRSITIKARQCGSGGFWTAEEIKRL